MASRSKVLSIFKALHRTRETVFTGDSHALKVARDKINEEFRRHKNVANPGEIGNLIKIATESDQMLRRQVIQAYEVRPNVYRIRKEHLQAKCSGTVKETCENCTCMP